MTQCNIKVKIPSLKIHGKNNKLLLKTRALKNIVSPGVLVIL